MVTGAKQAVRVNSLAALPSVLINRFISLIHLSSGQSSKRVKEGKGWFSGSSSHTASRFTYLPCSRVKSGEGIFLSSLSLLSLSVTVHQVNEQINPSFEVQSGSAG